MLLPELDINKTRKNAREVLKSCRSLQRKNGTIITLQSPVISDMPRYTSNRNIAEQQRLISIGGIDKSYMNLLKEDREKLKSIVVAFELLPKVSREILYYSYIVFDSYSIVKLSQVIKVNKEDKFGNCDEVYYSSKNIEKLKGKALIEFAEAYKNGELLVYKK